MKWIHVWAASILAVVVLAEAPMVVQSNSVVMASVTAAAKPSSRNSSKEDASDSPEKDSNKKKSFWASLGGGKKKDAESVADKEEAQKEQPKKREGPFGMFGRPKEEKKKDTPDDSSKENKAPENEQKSKGKEESKETETRQESEEDNTADSPKSEGGKEKATDEESNNEKKDEETKDGEGSSEKPDSRQQQSTQQDKTQQYSIIYRSIPISSPLPQRMQPGPSGLPSPSQQSQIMLASALANLLGLWSRLTVLSWLARKLKLTRELKEPEQHFMWECINDKYHKDDMIWGSVQGRPPLSLGISKFKWNKIVKRMGPSKEERKKEDVANPPPPSRTVVVIDLNTMKDADAMFSDFYTMVAFLVSANARSKKFFGSEPEVILNIQSPGGEVTSFALAAEQVNRLRMAGYKVTACVDRFAASGGYMIASQATQIIAAPFAVIGSVGVMLEGLNFYDALKSYGVKSIVLKAGDQKNPITSFGQISDKDMKTKLQDLEGAHQDFVSMCRSKRPELDLSVCNGRILNGEKALESGMIDRILTSEEYIFEKISDGDLVMKLHLISPESEHIRFLRALQILPHIRYKLQSALTFLSGGRIAQFDGFRKAQIQFDQDFFSNLVRGVALVAMVHRAIQQSGFWKR